MAFSLVDKSVAIDWFEYGVNWKPEFDEMDTDNEPELQIGSIVEIGGDLYILTDSDLAATGWAGIATSTQAYIYAVPAGATASLIYSITAPTWSNTKRGWYNGANKALLAVYKDAAGTGYCHKQRLLGRNETTGIGTFVTTVTQSATGTWQYSADFIVFEPGSYYGVLSSTGTAASNWIEGRVLQKVNSTYTDTGVSTSNIIKPNTLYYISVSSALLIDCSIMLNPGTYRLAVYSHTDTNYRTLTLYRAGRLSNDD